MDTTDPNSLSPATESPSAAPSTRVLIEVEISTLDQYGDPGFVHTRGHFHSPSTAARFAVSQAETVADLRQVDTEPRRSSTPSTTRSASSGHPAR